MQDLILEALALTVKTQAAKALLEIAARAVAKYLIPGCVGRGVRLGSESLFGGGVWKSGNHDSKKVLPRGPKKRPMTPKKFCLGVQKRSP